MEGSSGGCGEAEADVLAWGALGSGKAGGVEVCGAVVGKSCFVGCAREEGEGDE